MTAREEERVYIGRRHYVIGDVTAVAGCGGWVSWQRTGSSEYGELMARVVCVKNTNDGKEVLPQETTHLLSPCHTFPDWRH